MFYVLKSYFEEKEKLFNMGKEILFKLPYNDKIDSILYIGDKDNEGWIEWKPLTKQTIYNFKEVEKKYNIILHQSIKEYFNSLWFLALNGHITNEIFDKWSIHLTPVVPGKDLTDFEKSIDDYKFEINNSNLEYIPMGHDGGELLVVIENQTGKVFFQDIETGNNFFLANSLVDLISILKLN